MLSFIHREKFQRFIVEKEMKEGSCCMPALRGSEVEFDVIGPYMINVRRQTMGWR